MNSGRDRLTDGEVLDSGGGHPGSGRDRGDPPTALTLPTAVLPVAVLSVVVLVAVVLLGVLRGGVGGDRGIPRAAAPPARAASPAHGRTADGAYVAAPVPGNPSVRVGAGRDDEGRLPVLVSALPYAISLVGEARLSRAPVERAVALFQRFGDDGFGPVLVLGSDGNLRELDVVQLRPVRDESGNRQIPLDESALSPDGRRAAFAQPDAVVVADLAHATARRWPLEGFNENVSWRPDGVTLLVEQENAVFLLNTVTGATTRHPDAGFGMVVGGDAWSLFYRLRTPPGRAPELTLRDEAGSTLIQREVALSVGTGEWWGTGWLNGGLIAHDVFGSGAPRHGAGVEAEAIVVLDAVTGRQAAALVLAGSDRWKGCCAVMGWYDADTVLFTSRGRPSLLLAWRVSSGELLRVTEFPDDVMAAFGDITPR